MSLTKIPKYIKEIGFSRVMGMKSLQEFLIENWIFLVLLTVIISLLLIDIGVHPYIGHGEMAHYPHVASNLLEGKGYSVDYIYHFYNLKFLEGDEISHPDDYFPIGNPTLIAIFFIIFGESVFIAKITNVFLIFVLSCFIYFIIKKMYNKSIAIFTFLFTVTNVNIFSVATWPYADIGFLLFANISLLSIYFFVKTRELKYCFWFSIFTSLSIYFKQTGLLLVPTFFVVLLYYSIKDKINIKNVIKISFVFSFIILILISPILVREYINQGHIGFGLEVHSSMDKYGPWEEAYSLFQTEDDLPGLLPFHKYGIYTIIRADIKNIAIVFQTFLIHQAISVVIIFLALLQLFFLRDKDFEFTLPFIIYVIFYLLFLIFVWHYETRYFIIFFPFVCFLASLCIFRNIKQFFSNHLNWIIFISLIILIVVFPFLNYYYFTLKENKYETAILESYDWMKENIQEDAVIMTRNPWELTFHTGIKSIVIPYTDYKETMKLVEKYDVSYIDLSFTDEISKSVHQQNTELIIRQQILELYLGNDTEDFELVYENDLVYIFKIKNKS